MKNFLKSKKGKIILLSAIILIIITVILIIVLSGKEESYRTIVADEVNGEVVVSNDEKDKVDVYAGEHLYNGDTVSVGDGSSLTMKMDNDKYILAEENSKFSLKATGRAGSEKTVIKLKKGAVLSRLENILQEGDSYKVSIPNATMSVRGTVFRVSTYEQEEMEYIKLEVFNGEVDIAVNQGAVGKREEKVLQGEMIILREDKNELSFVEDENGNIKWEINYNELTKIVIKELLNYIEDGEELCIGKEELLGYYNAVEFEEETENPENTEEIEDEQEENYIVTFLYDGMAYGQQEVKSGGLASRPLTNPSSEGDWDYDFTVPVTGHIIIEWKQ